MPNLKDYTSDATSLQDFFTNPSLNKDYKYFYPNL